MREVSKAGKTLGGFAMAPPSQWRRRLFGCVAVQTMLPAGPKITYERDEAQAAWDTEAQERGAASVNSET